MKQKGYTLLELIITILALAGIPGWIMNLGTIIHALGEPLAGLTLLMAFRVIGVFIFPLGMVLGYF